MYCGSLWQKIWTKKLYCGRQHRGSFAFTWHSNAWKSPFSWLQNILPNCSFFLWVIRKKGFLILTTIHSPLFPCVYRFYLFFPHDFSFLNKLLFSISLRLFQKKKNIWQQNIYSSFLYLRLRKIINKNYFSNKWEN